RVGNWDIPHLADGKMPPRSASGRHVAVADDIRMREVGRGHSSWEAGEQGGAIPCGAGGAKGRGQGECRPATHALDPVPGCACHRRWAAYAPPPPRWSVRTRGGSRMRESCTYGSVRGAGSNRRPYRDRSETPQQPLSTARPRRGFRCAQPILLSLLQDIPPRPYLAVQPVRFAQDRPGLNDGPVRHVIEELQDVGEVPRCAKLRSDLGC